MNARPLVSVIMPAYNAEHSIAEAVSSVQLQSIDDWELIVVDDASTDGTREILESLARADGRLKLLRNTVNEGRIRSRNTAIAEASGRYIAFLDSDDQWQSQKLEVQLAAMSDENAVISFTAYWKRLADDGRRSQVIPVPGRLTWESLLLENVMPCSSVVYDTRHLGKRYMNERAGREDFMLWLDILSDGYEAIGINEPLLLLTKQRGSQSANKFRAAIDTLRDYRQIVGLRGLRLWRVFASYAVRSLLRHRKW